ncbi:MAG: S41 family peptidase [Fulvivirga sp.]|nr:S41 family peptidase [Fulvivirga sp.]
MKTLITILMSLFIITQPVNDEKKAERVEMLDKAFSLLEEKIANPKWLEDESFKSFKELIYSDSVLSLNDKDFRITFNRAKQDLPFTHFSVYKKRSPSKKSTSSSSKSSDPMVTWEEINKQTAYLEIKSWMVPGSIVSKALEEIGLNKYDNLIIDLRNNGGGHLEGPIAIAQFLSQKPLDGGYYLTRKWFDNQSGLPTAETVEEMPLLQDLTYAGIKKMFNEEDAFRLILPGHKKPVYQGKTYVLMGKRSGSSSEALLYALKSQNMATLVGETSAGALLSGSNFDVDENYGAFIPIADYYMADGFKIDKIGVNPDIEVEVNEAKTRVLKLIEEAQ